MEYVKGNIADTAADSILNPVNSKGQTDRQDASLALTQKYPGIVEPYTKATTQDLLQPGKLQALRVDRNSGAVSPTGTLTILNFSLRETADSPTRLEWLDEGLSKIPAAAEKRGIRSIAIPQIGGAKDDPAWADIHGIIEKHARTLNDKGVRVLLYGDQPERARTESTMIAPKRDPQAPEKFTFFYAGDFSQWSSSRFTENGITFNRAEQYMMHKKAELFGDTKRMKDILDAKDAKTQKDLGRLVTPFNDEIWREKRKEIVRQASRLKYGQNPRLLTKLLATEGTTLVEASPKDTIWGIGLSANDPRALNRSQWRGLNLLGEALTEVRDEFLMKERVQTKQIQAASPAPAPVPIPASPAAPRDLIVVNLKAIRKNKSDPLPLDVADVSRYSTLKFDDGTRNGIQLGNEFVMNEYGGKDGSREDVIRKFAIRFSKSLAVPGFQEWLVDTLKDKDKIGCYCAPQDCHANVIRTAVKAIEQNKDPIAAIAHFTKIKDQAKEQASTDVSAAAPQSDKIYTGIGARKTPEPVLRFMTELGARMAKEGYLLRSGGAGGADDAYEKGADRFYGSTQHKGKQIFLPWNGFQGKSSPYTGVTPEMMAMAARYHPAWNEIKPDGTPVLSEGAKKLHARNTPQVLGPDLKTPTKAVVTWTPNGEPVGGTGQALRMAEDLGIPVINLGHQRWRNASIEDVVSAIKNPGKIKDIGKDEPLVPKVQKKSSQQEFLY